ncbi:ketopantoate reductase [Mariprofundus ferrinatatus]|uniref:2-dehydropantoate 2-reductase n=1 Tax=Mariprofundus ferrinatatus TaxID=1921087 RepID=A0A2K8L4M7_9PROT|nr:2-dehydropantoate 2-reductase [Mariprofundus ferrinatatus]ATX81189.1 ketopantoate reductase [Mariprofundus ferrinatatus]
MRVVFAGSGAVGSHYGSRMQQAGNEIIYLARGAHLEALQKYGLLHESEGRRLSLKVHAGCAPDLAAGADVVVFSSKMTGLEDLIETVKGSITPDSLLVTLQNGIEAPDWVAKAFPDNAVAAGSAFIGARLEAPGHVIHSAAGGIRLGLWQCGAGEHQLCGLVEQLQAGHVPARIDDDPAAMLWRKLLWNTGFNAITAISRRFAREMCESEELLAIVQAAMRETVAVALAEGIDIGEQDILRHIDATLMMGPVKTSMWQDIEAGHLTEVDYLNGVVVRRGAGHDIATPVNRMLTALVHAVEGSGRKPGV